MRLYTIYRRGERWRSVPDGFSFGALVFGPLWLLRHGAVAAALALALAWIVALRIGALPLCAMLVAAAGLFGRRWRGFEYELGGWRAVDTVAGVGGEHALLRHRERTA